MSRACAAHVSEHLHHIPGPGWVEAQGQDGNSLVLWKAKEQITAKHIAA